MIAARVAGAAAWGDRRARRVFSASGNGPQVLAFDFGSDAVGLLRGLGEDEIVGPRAAVVNLDYRFPLTRIDRGLGTLPGLCARGARRCLRRRRPRLGRAVQPV